MTNHHPLTDQIIQEELITQEESDRRLDYGRANYYEEDFRTGADWQLRKVEKHLDEVIEDLWVIESGSFPERLEEVVESMKNAMRPPVVVTLKGQILDVLNEDTMAMGSQLHRIRKLVDQMENNS